MGDEPAEAPRAEKRRMLCSVLLFWAGYVAICFSVGLVTGPIGSEVWRLSAWGLISSVGLIFLSRRLARKDQGEAVDFAPTVSSAKRLCLGLLVGAASFGAHMAIVSTFAGPIHFERAPEVGALTVAVYFTRFLATSCMEEVGFRGYALQRLRTNWGLWPAVCITAIAFGLSHLLYGWDLQTIALGVVPGGLLWGMSAIATRGLAVPIGLHAAWNFTGWSAGARAETGLLRMIVADDGLGHAQTVGTASYLGTFGVLTLAFWLLHRRNEKRREGHPQTEASHAGSGSEAHLP